MNVYASRIRSSMDEWPVLESVTEYETGWYSGGYDRVVQPDGTQKRYYWAELPPAVIIVPRLDNEILFVEQYRPVIADTFLELPAGIVEPSESFTEAAHRELREETGYAAGRLELLEEFWVATGVLRHPRGIVYADDLTPGTPRTDSNEFLTVTTRHIDDALPAARADPANDATIEGLLLADADGYLELT